LMSALAGGASYIGAQLMNSGDFRTPFFLMAACMLISCGLFYQFFAKREADLTLSPLPKIAGAKGLGD
jgi:sulfite exporter TauE/SafE